MTAIVGVLNTHGVAIAADSATTFSSNDNIQKVHNKGNKIFALSKKHSIGIAIYNSAIFMDIPWEVVIKMYRKHIGDTVFNTINDCKSNFIEFLNSYQEYVTQESKSRIFFTHFSGVYYELTMLFESNFTNAIAALDASENKADDVQNVVNDTLEKYFQNINGGKKNPVFTITFEEFTTNYENELIEYVTGFQDTVRKTLGGYTFSDANIETIKKILYTAVLLEYIYENHCGLIFMGYGEKEVFPSSHLVLVGNVFHNTIRYRLVNPVEIKPISNEGAILPYAQTDVTESILKGIDPNVSDEMHKSIKKSYEDLITLLQPKLEGDEADKIKALGEGLIDKIKNYTYEKITNPIIKMLNCMDKEDMADLAESLVNITSLRRKFSETNESVGGPIDVAVITKGDGFIWTKRKKYFSSEENNFI